MAAISMNHTLGLQKGNDQYNHGAVDEEIEGLIRVYKDGHVQRPTIVPNVRCKVPFEMNMACNDVIIDSFTSVWARIYVPKSRGQLPLLLYFHGGGFCVGSASWSCYHEFLAKLASITGCVIVSMNYRLASENRLPAAYDDGFKALMWVKQQALNIGATSQVWWCSRCNFSSVFLAGDSAGANLAHNIAARVGCSSNILNPLFLKGSILIQPFFGGEERTYSERYMVQPPNSALSVTTSDVYWRLSLPIGANRDHPYCNPLAKGATRFEDMKLPRTMVCISEMDILKDRNLEFCNAISRSGNKVEHHMYMGVGHAFQILHNSKQSQPKTIEMMSHIKAFINK
ncbi:hypothetical protein IFM89_017370 [Coptis chinensis]|uniref:Alpha/beta hydrolase fold-3 domain-containing protein n=1 Tax=Coptis chinensis TaxID=261450 RepID=A0A835H5W0_9MAGN|nr:hypothetical protein IFM89_017370 [Coptis chinensis]